MSLMCDCEASSRRLQTCLARLPGLLLFKAAILAAVQSRMVFGDTQNA